MKTIIAFALQLCGLAGLAQTGSEILLFDLSIKNDKLVLSNPKNITNHVGYDNQPSFHVDQPLIFYSSFKQQNVSTLLLLPQTNNLCLVLFSAMMEPRIWVSTRSVAESQRF
jgi:hypothetical protein